MSSTDSLDQFIRICEIRAVSTHQKILEPLEPPRKKLATKIAKKNQKNFKTLEGELKKLDNAYEKTLKNICEELADSLAENSDDYMFYYPIALDAIESALRNPSRYRIRTKNTPNTHKEEMNLAALREYREFEPELS